METKKRTRILLAVFMAMILFLTACASNEKDSKESKAGGKKSGEDLEDKVVVYSPHGKDILTKFQEKFKQEYGVEVEWLDLGSQEILDRVRAEKNNPQADIWWGGPSTTFDQGKDDELLEAYEPKYASALEEGAHDKEWFWSGTSKTPEVIMYNSKELTKEEAPQDWDDLLDPKWKDKIIIRYPLASGTMRTIYSAMIYPDFKETGSPEKGYEWLKKLDENTKEYSANPELMNNKIAKGEGLVSVWNMPSTVQMREAQNYPFDFIIPKSGTPVLTEGIALVKGGKNPKAAKAFYEFVNTPEAAKILADEHYRIPTRTDVKDLPDWITKTEIKEMDIDWKVFQEHSDEWMKYWDENIKNSKKEQKE